MEIVAQKGVGGRIGLAPALGEAPGGRAPGQRDGR